MAMAPIGIFGGIFDPVHNGHLAVAQLARDFLGLETVHFVPSGSPPHKRGVVNASSSDRVEMLRLALQGEQGLTVCAEEVNREGVSYTIDTLNVFRTRYPDREICFIIGSDNLPEISSWHRYREILNLVTLCVAHRPGHSLKPPASLGTARIVPFPSPEWGMSSTRVRMYLAKGYRCSFLIPDAVLDYIHTHRLYTA